jgi:hypothetical protein
MNKITRRKMNSFKKIALAVVAAMTMGTLIATPASAAVMTVAVSLNGSANTTNSAIATPAALPVPADNTVDATDALKFIATVDTGTVVSAVCTNCTIVSALHTSAAPVTSASGSSTLAIATGTGTTATFYVYTKTTAIGTVVITNQGTTLTYYVQGTAGLINNISVSAPASGAAGTKQNIVVTATDAFGNKVSGKSITATVFAATAVLDTATATTGSALSDFGTATFKATLPALGTRTLIMFAPTTSGDAAAADVVGLPVRALAPFAEIAVRDLAGELKSVQDALLAEKAARAADAATAKAAYDSATVTANAKILGLEAEVITLKADAVTAKVAADKVAADARAAADAAKLASDTALAAKDAQIAQLIADNAASLKAFKKSFNKLAKKWNAKNPYAKVKLVK